MLKFFSKTRKEAVLVPPKQVSTTIIITVYKRSYLKEQLGSLLNQTVLPQQIWILHYEDHIDITPVVNHYRKIFPAIFITHSDLNLKFFVVDDKLLWFLISEFLLCLWFELIVRAFTIFMI